MPDKIDTFDYVEYIFDEMINCESIDKINFEDKEKFYIQDLLVSFIFVQIFEKEDLLSKDKLNQLFNNNQFFSQCYFKGTNDYNNLINKYKELRKLNNNMSYTPLIIKNGQKEMYDTYSVYYFKNNILYEDFKVVYNKNILTGDGFVGNISYKKFVEYKKIAKSIEGGKFSNDEIFIPKKYFTDNSNGKLKDIDDLYIKKIGNNYSLFFNSKKVKMNSFFENKLFRLFSNNKEISINSFENLDQLLSLVRNGIIHYGIKSIFVDTEKVNYIKLENNLFCFVNDIWLYVFSLSLSENISKDLKIFYIPKHDNLYVSTEDCISNLSKGIIFNFNINNDIYIPKSYFYSFIYDLFYKYNSTPNIKKDICSFITDSLKDYPFISFENDNWNNYSIIKDRINNDNDFWKYTKKNRETLLTAISKQDRFLEISINNFYNNFFDRKIRNNETLTLSSLGIISIIQKLQFTLLDLNYDIKHSNYFGLNFEAFIAFSQLKIFARLVFNGLYDKIKQIDTSKSLDIEYLKSEEGILRTKLNEIDLSKIEIVNKDGLKKNSHKVKTLEDKIFALRLIRNSISHNGFSFKMPKTSSLDDIYVDIQSKIKPNLFVHVNISELLEILDDDFFRFYQKYDIVEFTRTDFLKNFFDNNLKEIDNG